MMAVAFALSLTIAASMKATVEATILMRKEQDLGPVAGSLSPAPTPSQSQILSVEMPSDGGVHLLKGAGDDQNSAVALAKTSQCEACVKCTNKIEIGCGCLSGAEFEHFSRMEDTEEDKDCSSNCALLEGSSMAADSSKDGMKCGQADSANRIFHLKKEEATHEKCGQACKDDETCEAWSGVIGDDSFVNWCIGCKVALETAEDGSEAHKKTTPPNYCDSLTCTCDLLTNWYPSPAPPAPSPSPMIGSIGATPAAKKSSGKKR